MQPLGRKKVKFPNKTKEWLGKGVKMWWENIVTPSKRSEKQKFKNNLNKNIDTK